MSAWSGFLSAHLVGQINGLLKRAHRYGFTLDAISVEDIAELADSKLFKSITHSNHCLRFLLFHVKDQVYSFRPKSHPYQRHLTKLNYTEGHLFLVVFRSVY